MGILLALFIGYATIFVILVGLLESFGGVRVVLARLKGFSRVPFPKFSLRRRREVSEDTSRPAYEAEPSAPPEEEAVGVDGRGPRIFPLLVALGGFGRSVLRIPGRTFTILAGVVRSATSFLGTITRDELKRAAYRLAGGFLFSLCIVAIAGEWYFRAQGPSYSSHKYLYRWHPTAGYVLNANYHYRPGKDRQSDYHDVKTTTNSYGFRSRDISFRKRGYRIMMLGDSFTFGTDVADEETSSWILEDLLRATSGYEKAEILNAGTNGSSNVSQINYFKSDGVVFNPDLVVLNLYTGNDFDQNLQDSKGVATCFRYGFMQAHTNSGDLVARAGWNPSRNKTTATWIYLKPSLPQEIDEYLHEKSWFYREVSDRLLDLRPVQSVLYRLGQIQFKIGSQERVNVHQTRTIEAGRKYTEELLTQFRDYLNQRGIKLLVHIIPIKNEVRVDRISPFRQDFYDNTQSFTRFLKERHMFYSYDAPVFEENENWFDLTYNALHGHYTYAETQISAAVLYRSIAREFLNVPEGDQERAMKKVVLEDIAMTRPEGFFTNNLAFSDAEISGYTRISRKDVETLKYGIPGGCSYGGGPIPFDKDMFESNLFDPQAPRVYSYPSADWGTARLDFEVVLKRRVNLKAVVAEVPAIYRNFSTTKMVVYDAETGESLAGALVGPNTWQLCARNIGEVQKLRISLFHYSGSNTFCLRGFHLLYNKKP